MPEEFEFLIKAILDDDRARVKSLLKTDPTLAAAAAKNPRYELRIAHWIYARDTALHVAAAGYRVEIAELLLNASADVGASRNHRHSQPLHYAADGHLGSASWDAKRQVAMIRLLVNAGADLRAEDKNGATALHRAVRTRCAKAVEFLLNAGSDPLMKNKPGSTPFHLAVQSTGRGGSGTEEAQTAQREIIRMFIERGIKPTIQDAKGKTVLDWARSEWIRQALTQGTTQADSTKPPNIKRSRR